MATPVLNAGSLARPSRRSPSAHSNRATEVGELSKLAAKLDVEKLVRAAERPWVSTEDLCVTSSAPDRLAIAETFRCTRGYASGEAAEKAIAAFDLLLHAATAPVRAYELPKVVVLGAGQQVIANDHVVNECRTLYSLDVTDSIRQSLQESPRSLDAETM